MLGNRAQFKNLQARVYLNHAAVAPVALRVQQAVEQAIADYAALGAGAWLRYRDQRERLRVDLARLVGGRAEDLALVPSTTQGIVDIAVCMPWRSRDRIALFAGEFPTNVTPWQQAAARFGLEIVWLRAADFATPAGDGLAKLETALRQGLRLVAVSAVQFQTGLRLPLPAISALCKRFDAQVFVDAIQAVGVVPTDVLELGVDYLVAGSHKWLMGIEGAGFLWIHPDRVKELQPTIAGWLSHPDPTEFLFEGEGRLRYDRPIRPRADFLEIGAQPTVGMAALGASVALLLELGVPAIFGHVTKILDALEFGLCQRGFHSARARDAASQSGILSVRPPAGSIDIKTMMQRLAQLGIACSVPDGWLRLSPHWPNDLGQVPAVLAAVDAALAGEGSA